MILEKSADVLLLNGYTVNTNGFAYGKTGIALTLFEIAEYLDSDRIYDHAVNLFQEVLACEVSNTDFVNGKAGIAFALQYLIKRRLLDADYMELYGKCHRDIIKKISQLQYSESEYASFLGYFLFIETSDCLSATDYIKLSEIIRNCIFRFLTGFNTENNTTDFVVISELLHAIICIQKPYGDFILEIERIFNKLILKNVNEPDTDTLLFLLQFYIYGALHEQPDIMKNTEKVLETLPNISTANFTLRQLTDIIIYILRIYRLNNHIDYRATAYKIMDSIISGDIDSFEQKTVRLIRNGNSLNFGLGYGFCRLLTCCLYLNKSTQNLFNDDLIKLTA
ncbi:MAG: hypothetical protein LBG92_05175 [Prevotellaceae bacterium]|nr:hypothetical protein [Prevotellaceae bacterium]